PGQALRSLDSSERPTFQKLPIARLAFEDSIFHDDIAAREHRLGYSADRAPFIGTVIDAHVMGFGPDGRFPVWIEDYDVGVGSHGNGDFPRKQSKDLGSRRGRKLNEPVETDPPLNDAAIIDQTHPVLDSGPTVRNLAEVIASEFLLLLETEWAMVCRD